MANSQRSGSADQCFCSAAEPTPLDFRPSSPKIQPARAQTSFLYRPRRAGQCFCSAAEPMPLNFRPSSPNMTTCTCPSIRICRHMSAGQCVCSATEPTPLDFRPSSPNTSTCDRSTIAQTLGMQGSNGILSARRLAACSRGCKLCASILSRTFTTSSSRLECKVLLGMTQRTPLGGLL